MIKINMIMLCHHFIVNNILKKIISIKYSFVEDDNAPGMPILDDQAPANEDNAMDIDAGHIPGADDTTLLSNVSDEFVLPPISTGKCQENLVRFNCFSIKLKHQPLDKQLNENEN
jgi:hypothetical protein